MEVTKWLKPSISVSRIGDSASVQAVFRQDRGRGAGELAALDAVCVELTWSSQAAAVFQEPLAKALSRAVAIALAERRVRAAMKTRRWR
jgi:hypothetical protein